MTALHINLGRAPTLPIDLLLASIPSLPRAALNALVDRAIERMDDEDGDLDLEANGDELDGTAGEDDFIDHGYCWAPGCPISDPDMGVDDDGEDDRASDA